MRDAHKHIKREEKQQQCVCGQFHSAAALCHVRAIRLIVAITLATAAAPSQAAIPRSGPSSRSGPTRFVLERVDKHSCRLTGLFFCFVLGKRKKDVKKIRHSWVQIFYTCRKWNSGWIFFSLFFLGGEGCGWSRSIINMSRLQL